ncbi:MAG: DUF2007 domain-containing protein [Caldilineaceae bacterium]|nr:DUF2007 domain-containing protein [Caldilineaceae bacterium]
MSVHAESFAGWFRRNNVVETGGNDTERASRTTTGGEGDSEPVVVWRATNQMEAEVVKGRLESAGIPAIVRGEALGAIYGLTTGSLAETAVLVPAPLAEQAEALLYGEPDGETDEERN